MIKAANLRDFFAACMQLDAAALQERHARPGRPELRPGRGDRRAGADQFWSIAFAAGSGTSARPEGS